MKHIICIISLLLCISCTAQTTNNIPVMEYYDASTETFDLTENIIPFYADGVVDFIYCTQDNEYVIEYMDYDIFDPDNLPQQAVTCVSDTENYVKIFCSEKQFFEYLTWYTSTDTKTEDFFKPHPKFYIKEVYNQQGKYWYHTLTCINNAD